MPMPRSSVETSIDRYDTASIHTKVDTAPVRPAIGGTPSSIVYMPSTKVCTRMDASSRPLATRPARGLRVAKCHAYAANAMA